MLEKVPSLVVNLLEFFLVEERRTVYSSLLNFLKNPDKEFGFDKDLDTTLIKSKLKALILRFAKGPEKKFSITR